MVKILLTTPTRSVDLTFRTFLQILLLWMYKFVYFSMRRYLFWGWIGGRGRRRPLERAHAVPAESSLDRFVPPTSRWAAWLRPPDLNVGRWCEVWVGPDHVHFLHRVGRSSDRCCQGGGLSEKLTGTARYRQISSHSLQFQDLCSTVHYKTWII